MRRRGVGGVRGVGVPPSIDRKLRKMGDHRRKAKTKLPVLHPKKTSDLSFCRDLEEKLGVRL